MDYQKIYKFDNGYGASVVCGLGTYGAKDGLFEVAVLDSNGSITYNTPITADVLGWLDFDGVAEVLNKIKAL
jgi:hypothetical protein